MGREFFDVENTLSSALEDGLAGEKRQVAKVLMIDCIELNFVQQVQNMRKFKGCYALILQKDLKPRNEVVDIRNMGQNIVCDE